MLELLTTAALWLNVAGVKPLQAEPKPLTSLDWLVPTNPQAVARVDDYVQQLTRQGFNPEEQGVWLQSNRGLLASSGSNQPLPAASLTKVATSLAALKTWGPTHQFVTKVGATGAMTNGVLEGDLVIQGGGDPLFVWEEAFSLGQALNQLGVRQVRGNLVITGNFAMNYEANRQKAGEFLRQALDPSRWPAEAASQFATLPKGSIRPQVLITGKVVTPFREPIGQIPILQRQSLPLADLVRRMNIYSNNAMAEMLASGVGGSSAVAREAALTAGVPLQEIQLVNGSGLGTDNRISPRAVCGMFQAIQRQLQPHNLTVADVFPMAGRDQGTVHERGIPQAAVVKTGSLWNVSALAGVLPTRDQGAVWFAIINKGDNLDGFRQGQDRFLQSLAQSWGTATSILPEFIHRPVKDFLGDPARNQILLKPGV